MVALVVDNARAMENALEAAAAVLMAVNAVGRVAGGTSAVEVGVASAVSISDWRKR